MTEYFISSSLDGLRMRVSFKDVVDFRKQTIKIYSKSKGDTWDVYLFDYHQKYLGDLYSFMGEVRWIASGSLNSKRVTKDGKIYKADR